MKQPSTPEKSAHEEEDFGMLLRRLRKRVMQKQILAHLPGWSKHSYSRLEMGDNAPAFDQLRAIYRAFLLAGVSISLDDQQQFLRLARKKIESKKTRRDPHSDEEWAALCSDLTRLDRQFGSQERQLASVQHLSPLLLAETSHLLGREAWRESFKQFLRGKDRKKVIVVSGPSGIGKSSELNWLAAHLFLRNTHRPILCDFRTAERLRGAEDALALLLGTILSDLGAAQLQNLPLPLDERIALMLEQIEKVALPVVVLLDHAEIILREYGRLAPCWERFFTRYLRQQHRATFILATNQWPGWFAGESSFIAQVPLPPLEREQGIQLLQNLGLAQVPLSLLQRIYDRVNGIPLCLEWVVALIKQPLTAQDWDEFEQGDMLRKSARGQNANGIVQSIERFLQEPHLFASALTDDVAPILERIIATQRLSPEARSLLEVVALATLPLARPALEVLCPAGPRPIKELQRANMLVAYPDRVQVLPTVAAAVLRSLSTEKRHHREKQMIQAYTAWVRDGAFYESEKGLVVAELATVLLLHHSLLDAAQLLINYGWLAFHLGHAARLAYLAEKVLQDFDWRISPELECGGLLLQYVLSRYVGKAIDREKRHQDYQSIYYLALAGTVTFRAGNEIHLVHHLMLDAMNKRHFEEAELLLDAYCERLSLELQTDNEFQALLLEKRAWLLGKWSNWYEECHQIEEAQALKERVIAYYRQGISLLACHSDEGMRCTPLSESFRKKLLATFYNNLAYQLNREGNYEEALVTIDQCLQLEEQGYVGVGGIAASYGEKSQILAELGYFQEALAFDSKALAEVQRLAEIGHTPSQEEIWIYRVNRGRLYLRLGRIKEAEHLLQEAKSHIQPRRSIYRMFAHQALEEIRQWRLSAQVSHHQLDWRWIERYRQLITYDAFWWWADAGPFTEEEEQQWRQLYSSSPDEETKRLLSKLITQSRQREILCAIAEQRQPRLSYPALNIVEIQERIAALKQLGAEIGHQEPHPIVRRFYQGAIAQEKAFLGMIEATHERNNERFWELSRFLYPTPTADEMSYSLAQVRRTILKGLLHPKTEETSRELIRFTQDQLQLPLDFSSDMQERQTLQEELAREQVPSQSKVSITAQAAQRFFETVLRESGYEGWQVLLDPKVSAPRVDSASRQIFLPDDTLTLHQIRHYLAHELAGHATRSMNGEQSSLGILAIGTQNYMPTEEGLTIYYERQAQITAGQQPGELPWLGMFAVGLASGVVSPPQKFLSLYDFFQSFLLLRSLLSNPETDQEVALQRAKKRAISRCLRTNQGVPDLEQAGICNTWDVIYLRGIQLIEQEVGRDETILDYLGIGKIAVEHLGDVQELGFTAHPQPLKKLAFHPDLDSFIMSFAAEIS